MGRSRVQGWTYRLVGLLIAVRVERGKQVNAGVLHEADDALVSRQVLLAQELKQQ